MMDAARLLPLLGVLLFLVPMLWLSGQNENGVNGARSYLHLCDLGDTDQCFSMDRGSAGK